MFKNIPSICYIFFAIDDLIVTSVNTYMSMTEINTEDEHLTKFLPENKNYGARRLLKMFLNKTWNLGGLKALIKKLTTQVLLFDCSTYWVVVDLALSAQYLCCQQFFDQLFQSTKTPVFVRNHFRKPFVMLLHISYFLAKI